MQFTLKMEINEESGPTIVRNIYECFRKLGDALMIAKGIVSVDHISPIKELLKLKVSTTRPINIIDNLRRLKHNINYYGYKPNLIEVKESISIAEATFEPLLNAVLEKIKD